MKWLVKVCLSAIHKPSDRDVSFDASHMHPIPIEFTDMERHCSYWRVRRWLTSSSRCPLSDSCVSISSTSCHADVLLQHIMDSFLTRSEGMEFFAYKYTYSYTVILWHQLLLSFNINQSRWLGGRIVVFTFDRNLVKVFWVQVMESDDLFCLHAYHTPCT